jgi:hypothetical protein
VCLEDLLEGLVVAVLVHLYWRREYALLPAHGRPGQEQGNN